MQDQTYNGWTNYETWLVNLWLTNDEYSDAYWREAAQEEVEAAIADEAEQPKDRANWKLGDRMKDETEEAAPELLGMYNDLLGAALASVNWREIGAHFVEDVPVYSAGWNMPGYLPETPPALFASEDEARAYIVEELNNLAEGTEDEAEARAILAAADTFDGLCYVGQYAYFVEEVRS